MSGYQLLLCLIGAALYRQVNSCQPDWNACQFFYDPSTPLMVHDTGTDDGYCVCPEVGVDVCFAAGSSFTLPVTANYQVNSGDCDVICAMSDDGEVCATQCSISTYNFQNGHYKVAEFSENRACAVDTVFDSCCPDRGEMCTELTCEKPRCEETYTTTGCLVCGCYKPDYQPPCPFPESCAFHDIHYCCDENLSRCSIIGDGVDQVFPEFLYQHFIVEPFVESLVDYCGGFPFDIRTCKGVITSDENCCPVACVVPCDCAPLNEANAADWNLILQQGNGQNPTDILKSSPDSLHVGGPRRLFFNRVDEEAFCLSKITLEVKCARRVYIKINFKNALSQQFDVNIPAGSQSAFSTVTLGPYTHEDVASVRIGFNSANNGCGPILANELVMSPCEDTP